MPADTMSGSSYPSRSAPLLIVFYPGLASFASAVGQILGQSHVVSSSRHEVEAVPQHIVVAVSVELFLQEWSSKDADRTTVVAHDMNTHLRAWDDALAECCHFEYLYEHPTLDRRDLARFLTFILDQQHDRSSQKNRINVFSPTNPDLSVILPDLDILTIGADAIGLRVDTLRPVGTLELTLEPSNVDASCSLDVLARQFMLLRQRTELPIMFTLRTMANGVHPTQDSATVHRYLRKALQWACAYVDVELWLPRDVRMSLYRDKGPSFVISSFHDVSGAFKWSSDFAQEVFHNAAEFSDAVRMTASSASFQDELEMQAFRRERRNRGNACPSPSINLGTGNENSLCTNKVFAAITHPLLPTSRTSGKSSASDIHKTLHNMGELPSLDFYDVGHPGSNGRTTFMAKCFNEMGLPHRLTPLEQIPNFQSIVEDKTFGGLCLHRPSSLGGESRLRLSDAAKAIGQIDAIAVQTDGATRTLKGENVAWKAVRAMLTRRHVPSAYLGKPVLVLANSELDARPTTYALSTLATGIIYTIGYQGSAELSANTRRLSNMVELTDFEQPFAVVNMLPSSKSGLVLSLLKHYGRQNTGDSLAAGRVFLDLTDEPDQRTISSTATSAGWLTYDAAEIRAWTIMEMMAVLVGQNVPYEFVKQASGSRSF